MRKTAIIFFLMSIMFLSGGTYNKDGFQAINSGFEKSGIEFVRFDICARGNLMMLV